MQLRKGGLIIGGKHPQLTPTTVEAEGLGTCRKPSQHFPRLAGNMDIPWEGSEVAS